MTWLTDWRTSTRWENRECDGWIDDDNPCTFDGEVELTVYGPQLHWMCPVCRKDHDEDDEPMEEYDND